MMTQRSINLTQQARLSFPGHYDQTDAAELEAKVRGYLDEINHQPGSTHSLEVEVSELVSYGHPMFTSEALGISAIGAGSIIEALSGRVSSLEMFGYYATGGAAA